MSVVIRRTAWLAVSLFAFCTASANDALVDEIFSDTASPAGRIQLADAGDDMPDPDPETADPNDYPNLEFDLEELKARLDALEKGHKKATAASSDKKEFPTFRFTGFTQLDTAIYDQDPLNKATVGNAQNGTGFRRARLAILGKVAEFTSYQLEMDFATAGRPSFFDTYVEQSNMRFLGTMRVGQYCQPFSIDALTGFRHLTFLERSLPFLAFVPFRRIGAQSSYLSEDEMSSWAVSVFRTGGFQNAPLGDNRFGTDFGDLGGFSVSTRATHLVRYDHHADDRYLWAIGGSYNYSVLGANTADGSTNKVPFYQTRVLPEFGPLGNSELSQPFGFANNGTPAFIDSGRYPANYFNLAGLETVYQNGPWGFQSEYMVTVVESDVGPIFYNGAYAQLAYRLTGEHRAYNKKNGTLERLVPFADFIPLKKDGVRGWGAWEIAGRWSFVDIRNPEALNGHYLNGTSNAGNGTLHDTTLGFTWFLNTHTKLQGNWIHCMLNNEVTGHSTANLFVSRVQVDF
ncbi:OprO/OprP family phosphate-selective porin [Planctomicrobium sp. SH661]|uniref:OprO/OprP family phosphate-selective porin n=1 Tax=Planctomicrobium sp. SH661 TaxID=3448124 RepID=UPI003F5C22D5